MDVCVRVCGPPLLSVPVGLMVRRQLNDEDTGLSVLQALLVVWRLWGTLGVQHEDLGQKIERVSDEDGFIRRPTRGADVTPTCCAIALILQYSASAAGE